MRCVGSHLHAVHLCSFSVAEAQLLRRAGRPTSAAVSRVPAPTSGRLRSEEPNGRGDEQSHLARRGSNDLAEMRRACRRHRTGLIIHRCCCHRVACAAAAAAEAGVHALLAVAGQLGFQRLSGGARAGRPFGGSSRLSSGNPTAASLLTRALGTTGGTRAAQLAARRRVEVSSAPVSSNKPIAGLKDVNDRRREAGEVNAELLRLRTEYEAHCNTSFELIHPVAEPRLQSLYDLLLSTSQRAHAENSGARVIPPILAGNAFESEWLHMFKIARTGGRIVQTAGTAPRARDLEDPDDDE